MTESTSHLQPDGTTFPPLTPDPPPPPGYVDPLGELERLMERSGAAQTTGRKGMATNGEE